MNGIARKLQIILVLDTVLPNSQERDKEEEEDEEEEDESGLYQIVLKGNHGKTHKCLSVVFVRPLLMGLDIGHWSEQIICLDGNV